jgi:hypothetical protein
VQQQIATATSNSYKKQQTMSVAEIDEFQWLATDLLVVTANSQQKMNLQQLTNQPNSL